MLTPAALTRAANLEKRNRKIRDAFYQRFTNIPRALRPEREAVVAQLAQAFFLRASRVNRVVDTKLVRQGQ